MAAASDLPIVLYRYDRSPYARRLVWYLELRKIPYSECIQPPMLPRPDVAALGVAYRRIPLLTIGRDVYLDTRLIIQKLETLFPPSTAHPGLSSPDPEHQALAQLLSQRTVSGGLFFAAAQCIPAGMISDPAFIKDRAELSGVDMKRRGAVSPFSSEAMRGQRPGALAVIREAVRFLEEGLLRDGREWVLGSAREGPSLVDLEAVWVLHWLRGMPGALPAEVLGKESTPRVWAWIERFDGVVKGLGGKPGTVEGDEAAKMVAGARFAEEGEGEVDASDPVVVAEGFEKGQSVRMWPTDYGSLHRDAGKLLAMTRGEYVIETQGKYGSVRVHAPRSGFKIEKGNSTASKM
ncbi:Uu.00g106350.m01.CDS01 [Anthostomella pinea]|uniref:Uu.00g106350.m01.CDS01 n=1 Tax=Anthostomella pinea TaxID=933095 RepID=A0AAI8VE51_9PEZI|nr:Uu.00g106350.m01.CDS01 [Anthostomella pinea]